MNKLNRIISVVLSAATILSFTSCSSQGGESVEVSELRCRNLENPEGVDRASFSWEIESNLPNVTQSAWEIEIASNKKLLEKGKADIWQSGKQLSDQQLNVEPSGAPLQSGASYWWRVRIWTGSDEMTSWSDPAYFSLGLDSSQGKGQWITAEWEEGAPLPYFRKTFDASKAGTQPVRAVVYLSGLGCSDLFFNGQRVDSTRILDPAQTNYEQYALYSTFDVTPLLQKGNNCIGVMLGDGWYNQGKVWGPGFSYGKPILFAQMEITYKDGSTLTVATDETWEWTPGPILSSNIYAGEVYDANKEIKGWAVADTQLEGWKPARIASGVIPQRLEPQLIEPIRMQEVIDPVDLWQSPSGSWIFDFGVNVAGIPLVEVDLPQGTRLKMQMGELLDSARTIDYSTTGPAATGVIQTDEYICAGKGKERWTPRFTYHGFRYLELSGVTSQPDPSWIKVITVYTDVDERGSFECSDPSINRLHEMAVRTMLSNIHGLPTDCPHRERCGWLGDAHAVFPFESFNYDMNNFWMKYMADVSSTSSVFLKNTLHQKLYNSEFYFADKQPGIPFMISPGRRLCGVASPDWGTAVVQIPWNIYLYFGNKEALELYYGEMKQWVDHVNALTENHIVPYGLGDWCPPEGNGTIDCPIPLSSTAFHYHDADLVAQAAAVLGKTEDAAHYSALRDSIKSAFIGKFYDKENHTYGSQTANAMALAYGLVPAGEEKAVSDATVRNMQEKYDNFFHTGIFGLGHIGQALSRYGNGEAAWNAFTKKGENSFAWMWDEADATTLWEVLPTSTASEAVGAKASLNHPMQGVYDAWFYEDLLGIRPDASGPGFKVTRFHPTMTAYLEWAEGSVDTPYGKVSSQWKNENGKLNWEIEIPANASGLVALPADKTVTVNHSVLDKTLYPVAEESEGCTWYSFPSGQYDIVIE